MSLSPAEVETIVRVVIQRLRAATAPVQSTSTTATASATTTTSPPGQTLKLEDRVVTLRTLEGRLQDVCTVQVPAAAVITPAVRDELRDRDIQLDCTAPTSVASVSQSTITSGNSSLLLLADSVWSVHDRVFAEVVSGSGNLQSDSCRIAAHLNSGGQGSIWWSKSPFAALRGTMSNKALRAVLLPQAADFARAMSEADPNVLILDALSWQANQVLGLAKQWKGRQG